MIAIIDYDAGNLRSVEKAFMFLGEDVVVSSHPETILSADKVVLPGVGAFGDAARKLRESGMAEAVMEQAASGKPLMGICLGMQLLFDRGYEYGEHEGLGLIHGEVKPISEVIPKNLKIPHMGWNALDFTRDSKLFSKIQNGDYVYFVHSYYAANCQEATIATAEYGAPLTAAVEKNNVFGCQFHP